MPRARVPRNVALPRLTGRGGALVVVGVALLGITLWFDLRDVMLVAFAAIVLPLTALGFVVLRVPRLLVQRTFVPRVGQAGASAEVRITVRNRGIRSFDGASWRDSAPDGLHAPPESVLPALGAWEAALPRGDDTATLSYRLGTPWRGVFAVGPLVVTTTDPFGLARVSRQVGSAHELVVTPRVTPLDAAIGTTASLDGSLHGLQRRSHPNSDELIAREYRYGDPLRRVNWRATARRGELMVRDEEQRGDPEARVLLDLAPAIRLGRLGSDDRHAGFELAVELVASIGSHLLGQGFQLRVDAVADPAQGALAPGAAGGYRMPGGDRVLLEDLARLAPEPTHAKAVGRATPAVAAASGETRVPGYAVLVDPDAADVQQLVALRAGFSPAVAFVLDSVRASLVDALEESDWRIVRVRRPADIPSAWAHTGTGGHSRAGTGRAED
ncbi:DUF58 domain-containing protein [Agromyces sp. MMS24-K17]|uniref:DUF58 domain-containing protein n=1 Tax=Agromyces sp. MMS24-K17 TaxID=3372850 RepID=UPI003753EA9D